MCQFSIVGSVFPCLVAIAVFVGGCGPAAPTRTAGTANLPPEQLATLHLPRHSGLTTWHGQATHIESLFIGEAQYGVKDESVFLVPPGTQTFTIDYEACEHGWGQVEAPFNTATGLFSGPFGRFEATLEAGGNYALVASEKSTGKYAIQTEHRFERVEPPAKPK